MRNDTLKIALAALAAGASVQAHAAVVPLANANFETGAQLGDGQYVSAFHQAVPGWGIRVIAAYGRWNPTSSDFSFGDQFRLGQVGRSDGIGSADPLNQSTLAQNVAGMIWKANTRYTLLAEVGNPRGLGAGFSYVLGLIAGGVNPAEEKIIVSSLVSSNDMNGQSIVDGSFGTARLVFETGSQGSYLGKSFGISMGSAGPFGYVVAFDNVRLEAESLAAPVPEPATWAMMIAGFGLMGAAARRRQPRLFRA